MEVLNIVRDVVCGLEYLHRIGFAHCDIKCENVVIVDGKAKLIDFSGMYSVNVNNPVTATTISFLPQGTSTKQALTIVEALEEKKFGSFTDIWAVGMMSIVLLLGVKSVWTAEPDNVLQHIKNKDYLDLIPDTISEQLKLVIVTCLCR
jgi:serine/threonine protein kinase